MTFPTHLCVCAAHYISARPRAQLRGNSVHMCTIVANLAVTHILLMDSNRGGSRVSGYPGLSPETSIPVRIHFK